MTKKFRVYGIMTASVFMGEFEAEAEAEAIEKAHAAGEYNTTLCHRCSREVELGDIHDEQVEEV